MLTTVRQQMICIIAPDWPGGPDHPGSGKVTQALEKLFSDVGVVHFASIALLPPIDDAPNQPPSLMLELAVEEGLRPYDLLVRLVNHPSEAMWLLYGKYWPERAPQSAGRRNQLLLDRLMKWHHIADGAFVGARDRSVRQIEKERDLLTQTRATAPGLMAAHGGERTTLALALARWAFINPSFEWASEPAPRSWFRGSGASVGAKLGYVLVVAGLPLALVWMVGALSRLLIRANAWLFERPWSIVQSALSAVSDISCYLLEMSGRFVLVLLAVGCFAGVFYFALPALFASYRRWLENLRRELDRPTETWSSWTTSLVGWLFAVPLLAVCAALAVIYVVTGWMPAFPGWKPTAIGALLIAALVGAGALVARLGRRFPGLNAWFYRPYEDDVHRAQQIHPSIDRCEAEQASGTAHMISLTDIRSPHRWSAWWIRVSLRIVTLFGRVHFTKGLLGDAPGIHFGHWHIIDNGRRFLFCSNYDGNFGGYLDDFINGSTVGTTLAWRWTTLKRRASAADGQPSVAEPRSFPPTRFIIFRGVKCEMKFKTYARDSMLPYLYRFDPLKLPIDEIDRATDLRDALYGERTDSKDDLIMRAIES